MVKQMLGAETEYFFAVFLHNGQRGDHELYCVKLIEIACELFGALRVGMAGACYLPNGSKLYIDCRHPEIATCECTSPAELLRYILAGDLVMQRLVEALEFRCPEVAETVVCRCHVDYSGTGVTWGAHESYLHRSTSEALQQQLLGHLSSRVIYSGAGGLDSLSPRIEFQIEPRTPHLQHVVSGSSTNERGIFHTKNESLSSEGFSRLHLLASATACSQTATFLRLGTTCLLVALTALRKSPTRVIQLADPLAAMQTFSRDVTCKAKVMTTDRRKMSAIEIQRVYLEEVTSELKTGNLPAWAAEVCDTWDTVLVDLDDNPMKLASVLDWPLKLTLFREFSARNGVAWEGRNRHSTKVDASSETAHLRAKLCEIDVRFSQIGEKGIFENLDRDDHLHHCIVPSKAIETACTEPPRVGRARLRAKWIKKLAGVDGACCDWQYVLDPRTKRRLDLANPFQEQEIWLNASAATDEQHIQEARARRLRTASAASLAGSRRRS